MNRRHFFKTVAATLAAGTAVVVAPAVVRGGEKPYRGPGWKGFNGKWTNYTTEYKEIDKRRIAATKELIRIYERELFGPGICLCPRD